MIAHPKLQKTKTKTLKHRARKSVHKSIDIALKLMGFIGLYFYSILEPFYESGTSHFKNMTNSTPHLPRTIKNVVAKLAEAMTFFVKNIHPSTTSNTAQGPRTHCPICTIPVIGVPNYFKQNFKNLTNAILTAATNYFYIKEHTTNAISTQTTIIIKTVTLPRTPFKRMKFGKMGRSPPRERKKTQDINIGEHDGNDDQNDWSSDSDDVNPPPAPTTYPADNGWYKKPMPETKKGIAYWYNPKRPKNKYSDIKNAPKMKPPEIQKPRNEKPRIITDDLNLGDLAKVNFDSKLTPVGTDRRRKTTNHMWTELMKKHRISQLVDKPTQKIKLNILDYFFVPEHVNIPLTKVDRSAICTSDIEINKKERGLWAFLRPEKSSHPKRHQAATTQTKRRHLAKVNKRLSAHSHRRAKKLRTRNKKLLRGRRQCANVLSKKVNKNQAKTGRPQSEKTLPRAKNKKATTFCEIESKASVKKEFPGPSTDLQTPRTRQVNHTSYSKKYPRNYFYRLIHIGAHNPEPRPRHCHKELKMPISPIKFPGKSPSKNSEDVPLSKLKKGTIKPQNISDARERLNAVPASSAPKIDGGRGPVESRIWVPPSPSNPNIPKVPAFLPWLAGQEPTNNKWLPPTSSHRRWGTPHSNPTTQAQDNPASGGPPIQDQQEQLRPVDTVKYFYRGHQETLNQEATERSAPGGELETEIVHPPPAPSSRGTAAEEKRKVRAEANAKLPKKSKTKPLPPPVRFPTHGITAKTPVPGPENAQKRSIGSTESQEVEIVHPPPAPSSEVAASGPVPGGGVGGGPVGGTETPPESTPEFVRVGPGYPERDSRPSHNTCESGQKLRFHGYAGETPDFNESDIFDKTTKRFVDLASESSQDDSNEVNDNENVGKAEKAEKVEGSEKDENANISKTADDKNPNPVIGLTLEEETSPSANVPQITKVPIMIVQARDSGLYPTIDLDRSDKIPIISLDRSEVPRFMKKGNYDRAVVESEDLHRALDRAAQLRNQRRVAKAELKARAKQTKKGRWPKVSKIVEAERYLNAPVASLHPEAPRHSTPKRVGLEELRDSLRHCTKHCSSFFQMNGQPSLSPGTWPDHLSWAEARKAYKRNYDRAVASHPSLAADLEHPSVYGTFSVPETEDEIVESVQIVDGEELDGEEEEAQRIVHAEVFGEVENPEEVEEEIIPVEELLANPIPTTSNAGQPTRNRKGQGAKKVGVAFPMDKYGGIIGHGIATFQQGISTDSGIKACLDKIARQAALKYALNNANLSAKAAFLARQEVAEKIEGYQDRLQYLTGHRRRLLQVLITQQENIEKALRQELEPTLSELGLTLDETRVENQEVVVLTGDEPETEEDGSHLSSNLSEAGLPDPEHPNVGPNSSGDDPSCACPGGRCRWYGECRNNAE